MTSENFLYGRRAEHYDRIYHFKDYAAEVASLRAILLGEGIGDGSRVLEAACGTGNYTVPLAAHYEVSGFDLSPEMLAIADRKLPGTPLFVADMVDFTVPEAVDAVTCMFSSIGYLLTGEDLSGACRSFARALRTGGCLIVDPWIFPEDWNDGQAHLMTYLGDEVKLCRANVSAREGRNSVLNFHWLAAWTNGSVEHWEERHVLRLWTREEMGSAFAAAGFEVRLEGEGRGRYVCRKK
jgi:SAM-dependent methyltransferase